MLEALLPTYIHTYRLPSVISDLHAMHNCDGGLAFARGCCVLMFLYLWFTGCAWDAMCAVTHTSAGEHGFAGHIVVPC